MILPAAHCCLVLFCPRPAKVGNLPCKAAVPECYLLMEASEVGSKNNEEETGRNQTTECYQKKKEKVGIEPCRTICL